MLVIWKFQLEKAATIQAIQVPRGAKSLTVGAQNDELVLWAVCDDQDPTETRAFHIIRTGEKTKADLGPYIGTALFMNGAYVVHVFEAHHFAWKKST